MSGQSSPSLSLIPGISVPGHTVAGQCARHRACPGTMHHLTGGLGPAVLREPRPPSCRSGNRLGGGSPAQLLQVSLLPSPITAPQPGLGYAGNVAAGWGVEGSWAGSVDRPGLCCIRNKDFQEVTLEQEGRVLLRFAAAYGFRNIQNLVQKLKRGRCPYHYVEVMACPAGSYSRATCTAQARGGPCRTRAGGSGAIPLLTVLRKARVGKGPFLVTTPLPALLCHRLLEWWGPAPGP